MTVKSGLNGSQSQGLVEFHVLYASIVGQILGRQAIYLRDPAAVL